MNQFTGVITQDGVQCHYCNNKLMFENKSGVFVDKLGHKYKLVNGIRVALNPDGTPVQKSAKPEEPNNGNQRRGRDDNQGSRPGGDAGANGHARAEGGEQQKPKQPEQPTKPVLKSPGIAVVRKEFTKTGDPRLVPKSLRQHLNPAQQQGVALAIEAMTKHGGFLNADSTGIGKTRQQLAVAKYFADRGYTPLIVSPAEVIRPNWETKQVFGSFANDSKAMGVPLILNDGAYAPVKGAVNLTTYDNLPQLVGKTDKNTVLILDESHLLKNPDSSRAKAAMRIMDTAHSVMYASATPGDKPMHMAHLIRANVFGNIGQKKTYAKLGMIVHTEVGLDGKKKKTFGVDPRTGFIEAARRISGLFDQMTKDGLMVRRELGMENVAVTLDRIPLAPEHVQAIENYYNQKFEEVNKTKPMSARAVALMSTRYFQEQFKIPHTVQYALEELKDGRSVVIFAAGVGDKGEQAGTAKQLKRALVEAGLKEEMIGDLHGGASQGERRKNVDDFQNGKKKILIATVQSGGTGINLDDTVGDRPRSLIMMTPPFTAGEVSQAMGRVNRLNTKSDVRVRGVLVDSKIDDWNAGILENKFRTLGAAVSGNVSRGSVSIGKETHEEWQKPFNWGESLLPKKRFEGILAARLGPKANKKAKKSMMKKFFSLFAGQEGFTGTITENGVHRHYCNNKLMFEAYDPNQPRDGKGRWSKTNKVLAHISGPSGSGKTTIANKLSKQFKNISFKDLDEFDDEAEKQLGWSSVRKKNYTDDMLEKLADLRQKLMDEYIRQSANPIIFVGHHTEGKHILNIPTENRLLLDIDAKTAAWRAYLRSQNEKPEHRRSVEELPDDEKEAQDTIDELERLDYKRIDTEQVSDWIKSTLRS